MISREIPNLFWPMRIQWKVRLRRRPSHKNASTTILNLWPPTLSNTFPLFINWLICEILYSNSNREYLRYTEWWLIYTCCVSSCFFLLVKSYFWFFFFFAVVGLFSCSWVLIIICIFCLTSLYLISFANVFLQSVSYLLIHLTESLYSRSFNFNEIEHINDFFHESYLPHCILKSFPYSKSSRLSPM